MHTHFFSYVLVLFVQPLVCSLGALFNAACATVFATVWNKREYSRKKVFMFENIFRRLLEKLIKILIFN
jgi:hypothetical protein